MTQLILSEDQKNVFDKLEWFLFQDQECRELRIGGLAGTGKTTVIAHFIRKFFVPLRRQYGSITIGALTGKAAERLNTALGEANTQKNAQTLHKILFTVEQKLDGFHTELESSLLYFGLDHNCSTEELEFAYARKVESDGHARPSFFDVEFGIDRSFEKHISKSHYENIITHKRRENLTPDSNFRIVENETLPALIFVDEASMVSKEYYEMLTDRSKGVRKLVFIGDHGQLPPICKPNEEKFNLMERPHETLTDIHRQLKGNPVIELAHKIRSAKNFNEIANLIKESPLRKISPQFAIKGSVDYVNQDSSTTWNDITHIVYKNKTRCDINKQFLEFIGNENDAPIICLKNTEMPNGHYLANGSRGLLKLREDLTLSNGEVARSFTKITVDFPHLGLVKDIKTPTDSWLSEKYNRWFKDRSVVAMDYAFAITCHKAQGSSWKTVVVWTNDMVKFDFDEYKRWVYTAITRAENTVFFVV
jgi:exodeoxyribonuclease-5